MKFGFGHIKDGLVWKQDIPMGINIEELEERDQGMAHQRDASTLRGRIKKDQFLAFKAVSKGEQERKIFWWGDQLIVRQHRKWNGFYFVVGS